MWRRVGRLGMGTMLTLAVLAGGTARAQVPDADLMQAAPRPHYAPLRSVRGQGLGSLDAAIASFAERSTSIGDDPAPCAELAH